MAQKQIIAQVLHSTPSALIKVDFKSGQIFQGNGTLAMEHFPRLVQEALQVDQSAFFEVEWSCHTWIDLLPGGKEQYRLNVGAKTTIPVVCQRCLDHYPHLIQAESQFVLMNTEQEVDEFPLENDEEDALLNSHEFNLLGLIEDELLLSIPLVTKHENEECNNRLAKYIKSTQNDDNLPEVEAKTGKLNPFASLKKLKLN